MKNMIASNRNWINLIRKLASEFPRIFAIVRLLLTHMAYSAFCRSMNDSVATKLDDLVEKDKNELIKAEPMPRKCQPCSLRTNHLREGRFEHQPNEYIGIDQLVNITKIYAWDIYELAK
jgi:hypothetical protein